MLSDLAALPPRWHSGLTQQLDHAGFHCSMFLLLVALEQKADSLCESNLHGGGSVAPEETFSHIVSV